MKELQGKDAEEIMAAEEYGAWWFDKGVAQTQTLNRWAVDQLGVDFESRVLLVQIAPKKGLEIWIREILGKHFQMSFL